MTRKVEKFEDLTCWQKARELANEIFTICEFETLNKDFITQRQLKGAALSTMNNIAEGFGRKGDKDFIKFLNYSSASAMEVRSMLYILMDRGYIDQNSFSKAYKLTIDHNNLTIGLIRYLNNKINKENPNNPT